MSDSHMPDPLKRAKERALRLLSVRNRSEWELRERLRAQFDNDVIDDVLTWLRRLKYVDDESFAEEWVTSRLRNKPSGPRKLAYELQQKGISPSIIERVLSRIDHETEITLACEVAKKRVARLGEIHSDSSRRKIYDFLARRGFSSAAVRRALEWVSETFDH